MVRPEESDEVPFLQRVVERKETRDGELGLSRAEEVSNHGRWRRKVDE